MMRIIIAEYPKSGGSWLVNLLGDALSLPKRDVYVTEGFNLFDISKHPWYEGAVSIELTESCVIKSHELPNSRLHNFPAKIIHLVRDGRDVVVSKYFYEKDFCVKNRILKEFNTPFEKYVETVAAQWAAFINAWAGKASVTCSYEELLGDTAATIRTILHSLGLPVVTEKIEKSIANNTRAKMKNTLAKAFQHNTFVRKGVAGDWKNHFSEYNKATFKNYAGVVLVRLGYENNNNW